MANKDEQSKADDAKRDELLRQLLKTPPTPHKPAEGKRSAVKAGHKAAPRPNET